MAAAMAAGPAVAAAMAVAGPAVVAAMRGGGARGGGGYGGGGARGGGYGGYGGGGMGGGSMSHSPSFSQPRQPTSQSGSYGNRNQSSASHPAGDAAAGAGYSNRNQSQAHPAGDAAAGAGYANRNQSQAHPAGAAAAGAGYANRNTAWLTPRPRGPPPARVMVITIPVPVTATGAAITMRGGVQQGWAWVTRVASGPGAPARRCMAGATRAIAIPIMAALAGPGRAVRGPQQTAAQGYNYSQPISTTAAVPEQAVAGQATSAFDQAREAFKSGDYPQALQLDQQALAQSPNDATMHEFLGLTYFAQGKYDQAASPLYAVLSVRPGWDWTTLSGMYPDVETYTGQLRALEAYVKANPDSATARFVLAYQYLAEGHDPEAIAQLKKS